MCSRLSVIIPGYNNPESCWRRCIESVIANIGPDDEVICVDDGSHAKPLFLQEYCDNDARVRIIFKNKNVGLAMARNAGLAVASGRYVTFVDSDDEVLHGIYEKVLAAFTDNYVDIVLFGVRNVWVSERLYVENVAPSQYVGELSARDIEMLYSNSLLNYSVNKVYRLAFLRQHAIVFEPKGMPCEDIIFVLRCIFYGARWRMLSSIGYVYYQTHFSLLSRYKRTYLSGSMLANAAWRAVKSKLNSRGESLSNIGVRTECDILKGEWDNIWRMGSPFSIKEKWEFLKQHKSLAGKSLIATFVMRYIYAFLRQHFYFRPIQRWHIKRINPNVISLN